MPHRVGPMAFRQALNIRHGLPDHIGRGVLRLRRNPLCAGVRCSPKAVRPGSAGGCGGFREMRQGVGGWRESPTSFYSEVKAGSSEPGVRLRRADDLSLAGRTV